MDSLCYMLNVHGPGKPTEKVQNTYSEVELTAEITDLHQPSARCEIFKSLSMSSSSYFFVVLNLIQY